MADQQLARAGDLKSLGNGSLGVSSAKSPPGQALEEYVRKLLSRVSGTNVCKPTSARRLQICCREHKHNEVASCTSQPDALMKLSQGTIVIEVKDYHGKVHRRELDKLLSDKISHAADHAILFLGAGSRLTRHGSDMLEDHGVTVVYLLESPRDLENEHLVREALEACHSTIGQCTLTDSDSSSESTPSTTRIEHAATALEVKRFRMMAEGKLVHIRTETVMRREVHDMGLDPEHDWIWIRVEFPNSGKETIDLWCGPDGYKISGRRYFLASVTKGDSSKPAVAWAVSPPSDGGADDLETALGWGTRLRLQAPTEKRPYPEWLLRARVKQLFSYSRPLILPSLNIVAVDDILDNQGKDRSDGSSEADPAIFRAAATQLEPESRGWRRTVSQSFQLRDGGVKGTSLAAPRLEGTMRLEVPRSMCKFDGLSLGPHLRVVTFSVIRPTSLPLQTILRLEARGVPANVFAEAQTARLQELTGQLKLRQALSLLQVDMDSIGEAAEDWGFLSRDGTNYSGCFAELLLAGCDMTQQPLLTVLRKRRENELKKAQRHLSIAGVWSCRGQPEPQSEGGNRTLFGNQIFCLVPDSDGTWRALVGPVLVYQTVDLDPMAIRLAEGVDSEDLRAKCPAGVLIFSTQGPALQEGLGWDFDGDYYGIIENPVLIPQSLENIPTSDTSPVQLQIELEREMPRLADVHADFLVEFQKVDKMGLLHKQWQALAGEGPGAAMTNQARKVASQYAMSVDVEKGGPRPMPLPHLYVESWDFMKKAKVDARRSPTAAGKVFRMARDTLQKWPQSLAAGIFPSLKADPDFRASWEAARVRLGTAVMQKLEQLAKKLREELIVKVKENMEREEADGAESNPESQQLQDEIKQLFQEWMHSKRREAELKAVQLGASLADLALAAWHQKYVLEETASKETDPDQFPWTIFVKELCHEKSAKNSCRLPQMERYRRLLLDVKDAAKAVQVEDSGPDLSKAFDALRKDLARRNCRTCAENLSQEHAGLWSDAFINLEATKLAPVILDSLRVIMDGKKVNMLCSELRYTKAVIFNNFSSGPQSGEAVSSLVDRLVSDPGQVQVLCLVAVRYHGHLYVVEGNRRLWALRQAELKLEQHITVKVDIQDMYLGKVKGQPVLRAFWEKFTTRNGGTSVEVVDEQVAANAPMPQHQSRKPSEEDDECLVFGKHKGKTFIETKHADPDYCGWVLRTPSDNPAFQQFKSYLRGQATSSRSPAEPNKKDGSQSSNMWAEELVSFGKHKGKKFGQVKCQDPDYCRWVLDNQKRGCFGEGFNRFAQFLRNHAT